MNNSRIENVEYVKSIIGGVVTFDTYKIGTWKRTNFPTKRVKPLDLQASPTIGEVDVGEQGLGYIGIRLPDGNYMATEGINLHIAGESLNGMDITDLIRCSDGKIRQQIHEGTMSLAESIGEYEETLGLLKGCVNVVFDTLRLLRGRIPPKWAALTKKGRTRKWTTKDVSAQWVAAHFAYAPPFSLLVDAMHQYTGESQVRRFKLQGGGSSTYTIDKNINQSINGMTVVLNQTGTVDVKVKHKLIISMDVGKPRFSAGNPLEWAWAGIPMSFVVDWMFGVGTFLGKLNPIPSDVQIIGGTLVKSYKYDTKVTSAKTDYGYAIANEIYLKGTYVTREPNKTLLFPPLPLKWKPAASGDILLTAMALLHAIRS